MCRIQFCRDFFIQPPPQLYLCSTDMKMRPTVALFSGEIVVYDYISGKDKILCS